MANKSSVERRMDVVLVPPLSLEADHVDNKAPSMLRRFLSLFRNVRPGADLTRFQLPPMFNSPKSYVQAYGELLYGVRKDMLMECAKGETAIDRMIAVVAWSITTVRPMAFGYSPYNPILGETHLVSVGTLNVLLEQVSHHPPVTALHATDLNNQLEVIWCHHAVPKFLGTKIEAEVKGRRKINLLQKKESYEMNATKLSVRLFPKPTFGHVGTVKIECPETGLAAELSYKGSSYFGFGGGGRAVKGKIVASPSSKLLYEIDGHWDSLVQVKDTSNGTTKVIYNAKEVISGLPTPTLRDPDQGVWETESAAVWAELNRSILNKDWGKAIKVKRDIEEKQRELQRERNTKGEKWVSKHFNVSSSAEKGWECSPKGKIVPPAPIVFPL